MSTRKRRSLLGSTGGSDAPAPDATPAPAAPRDLGAADEPPAPEPPPPSPSWPALPARPLADTAPLDPYLDPPTEPLSPTGAPPRAADGGDGWRDDAAYDPAREAAEDRPSWLAEEPEAPASDPRGYSISPREVAEAKYVGTDGSTQPMDSTDAGWGSIPAMKSPFGEADYEETPAFVPNPDRYKIKKEPSDIWRANTSREPTPQPARGRTPAGARPRRGRPFARTGDPLEDSPPTEEVPIGGMIHDASVIGGPVSISDLPPIFGGSSGKAQPIEIGVGGSKAADKRPAYLPDEPSKTPAPVPVRPKAKEEEPEERPAGGGLTALAVVAGVIAAVSVVVLLGIGGVLLFGRNHGGAVASDETPTVAPAPAAPRHASQVPVRGDLKTVPKTYEELAPVPDGAVDPAAAPTDAVPGSAEVAPVAAPVPAPVAAPVPAPAPAPVAEAPKPKPAPSPAPKPAPVAESTGTLKIKSNRRVLVYVNGAPIGYAPTDYKAKPGAYTVSAMVPGQPDTKQTLDAKIDGAGGSATVNFTF